MEQQKTKMNQMEDLETNVHTEEASSETKKRNNRLIDESEYTSAETCRAGLDE